MRGPDFKNSITTKDGVLIPNGEIVDSPPLPDKIPDPVEQKVRFFFDLLVGSYLVVIISNFKSSTVPLPTKQIVKGIPLHVSFLLILGVTRVELWLWNRFCCF